MEGLEPRAWGQCRVRERALLVKPFFALANRVGTILIYLPLPPLIRAFVGIACSRSGHLFFGSTEFCCRSGLVIGGRLFLRANRIYQNAEHHDRHKNKKGIAHYRRLEFHCPPTPLDGFNPGKSPAV